MFVRDGLHLSGKDELSAAVDSGVGSITNIIGRKRCLN